MIFQNAQCVSVPALGIGTYRLHDYDCVEGVAHALGLGYRHVDTAQSYENEEQVGEGMRKSGVPRGDVFLVSKLRPSNYERAHAATLESLAALGTDYLDLMLLHWPKDQASVATALEALARLQQSGAVRHVGVSNFPTALVAAANEVTRVFCNQVEYHPFLAQKEVLGQAERLDMVVTAYRPLAKGLTRTERVIQEIGTRHGKTPEQVTLRWLVQQPRVTTIPKSASPERRTSNIDVFDFELSEAEMNAVSSLARGQRLVASENAPEWDT